MGCNCSRDGTKIIISQKNKGNNQFVLKIHTPDSENVKILFHYSINDRETIINLFNSFFFSNYQEDELDANFISVYNKESDSFEYYIQRLAGYSIENEDNPKKGKMWNFYINKEKVDWTFSCNNNRIISSKDELDLKFEGESETVNNTNSYESKEFHSSDSNNV